MYEELFKIRTNDDKFWELLEKTVGTKREDLLKKHSKTAIEKGWAWDGSRIEDKKAGIALDFDVRNEEEIGQGKTPKYYYLSTIYFRVNPNRDYYDGESFKGELPFSLSLSDNTPDKIKEKLGDPDREMYFSDGKTVRVCRYNRSPFIYKAFFYQDTGILDNFQMHYNSNK